MSSIEFPMSFQTIYSINYALSGPKVCEFQSKCILHTSHEVQLFCEELKVAFDLIKNSITDQPSSLYSEEQWDDLLYEWKHCSRWRCIFYAFNSNVISFMLLIYVVLYIIFYVNRNQYGAIPASSSIHALISMTHQWSQATDGSVRYNSLRL